MLEGLQTGSSGRSPGRKARLLLLRLWMSEKNGAPKKPLRPRRVQQVGLLEDSWLKEPAKIEEFRTLERKLNAAEAASKETESQIQKLNSGNIHRAKAAGEVLLKIKGMLKPRMFEAWLATKRFNGSRSTAYNYLKIADKDFWRDFIKPRLPDITYKEAIALAVAERRGSSGSRRLREAQKLSRWLVEDILEAWKDEEITWLVEACDRGLVKRQIAYRQILKEGFDRLRQAIHEEIGRKPAA